MDMLNMYMPNVEYLKFPLLFEGGVALAIA